MIPHTIHHFGVFFSVFLLAATSNVTANHRVDSLKVLTWNIWHGGKEDGAEVGPQKVIEVLKQSGAEIIAIQETYGSGQSIADGLQYHYLPRGTNVSIFSKYPIIEDISVHEAFKCVGALIELPNRKKIAFYSIWLPYNQEIWEEGTRKGKTVEQLLPACQASQKDLKQIREQIVHRLRDPKYQGVPIIIAGDYNCMSPLDYSAVLEREYEHTIAWPTCAELLEHHFRDSFREMNPIVNRLKDRTWSPRFPKQEADRIDYVFYKSDAIQAVDSKTIDTHPKGFPSDHAAVLTEFHWIDHPEEANRKVRVASYNIKHGRGMDDKVDLKRTAQALDVARPDIVAFQEVDWYAKRSGSINQPLELAKHLKMYPAFGSFMDFQGGKYGLAILSRYPVQKITTLRLKTGNEPRVALAIDVLLPNLKYLTVVNIHFDWVGKDNFRYEQALEVGRYLQSLKHPYIIMGDFNDKPGSRTLQLFDSLADEIKKETKQTYTFPSIQPTIEIDFIFAGPKNNFKPSITKVIDERLASDHRPIFAEIEIPQP